MKPRKEVEEKLIKNCVSREFINDKNEVRIKSVMTGTVGTILKKISFQRNPLKQSEKKKKNCFSKEFDIKENEYRIKSVLWWVR